MSALVKATDSSNFESRKELFKRTFCKGATDDELALFDAICQRTGLDPSMRQIYPVSRYDSKIGKHVMTFQTSIDGFRAIAERTECYSPGRESTFIYDDKKNVVSSTAYVKKMTKDGTWHEVAATAYYVEYVQKTKEGKPTQFWNNMPHTMLSKCAESLALRKAFPAQLSGLYTSDEMGQAKTEEEPQKVIKEKIEIQPMIEILDLSPITEQQCETLTQLKEQIVDKTFVSKIEDRIQEKFEVLSWKELPCSAYEMIKGTLESKISQQKEVMNGSASVA